MRAIEAALHNWATVHFGGGAQLATPVRPRSRSAGGATGAAEALAGAGAGLGGVGAGLPGLFPREVSVRGKRGGGRPPGEGLCFVGWCRQVVVNSPRCHPDPSCVSQSPALSLQKYEWQTHPPVHSHTATHMLWCHRWSCTRCRPAFGRTRRCQPPLRPRRLRWLPRQRLVPTARPARLILRVPDHAKAQEAAAAGARRTPLPREAGWRARRPGRGRRRVLWPWWRTAPEGRRGDAVLGRGGRVRPSRMRQGCRKARHGPSGSAWATAREAVCGSVCVCKARRHRTHGMHYGH